MQDFIKTMQKSPFLIGGSIILTGSLLTSVLNYVFNLVMGRMLSPSDYGAVVSLVTLTMLAGVPGSALTLMLAKRTAVLKARADYASAAQLFRFVQRISWIAGIIGTAVLLALTPFFARFFHTEPLPFIIFSLIAPVTLLAASGGGILQGNGQFVHLSAFRFLSTAGKLALSIALVWIGLSVSGVIAAVIIGSLLSYMYARWALMSKITRTLGSGIATQVDAADYSWRTFIGAIPQILGPIFYATVLITIFTSIDVIIVKHFLEAHAAGEYSALAIIGRIVTYSGLAIVTVLLPEASAAHAKRAGSGARLLAQSLLLVLITGAAIAALFFIAPQLVITLLFGATYQSVAPYLGLFGLAMLFGSLSFVFVHYYMATQAKYFLYPFGAATMVLIIGLWLYHSSIQQIAFVQLVANGLLLITMGSVYFIERKRCL